METIPPSVIPNPVDGKPNPTPEQIHAMKRLKVLAIIVKKTKPYLPGEVSLKLR